jgi:hypothetical protein
LRVRIRDLRRALDQENAKAPAERRAQRAGTFSGELAKAERDYQNLLDDLRATDPDYAAARAIAVPRSAPSRMFPRALRGLRVVIGSDGLFYTAERWFDMLALPSAAFGPPHFTQR